MQRNKIQRKLRYTHTQLEVLDSDTLVNDALGSVDIDLRTQLYPEDFFDNLATSHVLAGLVFPIPTLFNVLIVIAAAPTPDCNRKLFSDNKVISFITALVLYCPRTKRKKRKNSPLCYRLIQTESYYIPEM